MVRCCAKRVRAGELFMKFLMQVLAFAVSFGAVAPAFAQDGVLSFATVERPPFATQADGTPSGFSIELTEIIAANLGQSATFEFYDNFPEMLSALEEGFHDGAVANISITADRERVLDFTQPIFEGGIGVLLLAETGGNPILSAILTRDFLIAVVAALGLLFGSGMLMWVFERRAQAYFDRPARDALFPSFWWALNVVVNGGFEERMPQSRMGRLFSVVLVVASLFMVSVFVATITASMTVEALQDNVDSINDLEGQRVATITDSTSAEFLSTRDLPFRGYTSPAAIFADLEEGRVDAVVFDAPILSFYANTTTEPATRLLPRIYRPENYGIAVQPNSPIREEIDRALLDLREDGTYGDLVVKWFGRP